MEDNGKIRVGITHGDINGVGYEVIGKASFGPEKLMENFNTLVGAVIKAKPAAAKGQYIKSCVVATTMGPGIKVNYAKLG